MKKNKYVNDTVNIVLGGIAINESNKLPQPFGNAIGTTIGVGLLKKQLKKGGF